jgi:hypothetical protein
MTILTFFFGGMIGAVLINYLLMKYTDDDDDN